LLAYVVYVVYTLHVISRNVYANKNMYLQSEIKIGLILPSSYFDATDAKFVYESRDASLQLASKDELAEACQSQFLVSI